MSDHTDRIARRMGAEFVPMTDNAQAEMVGRLNALVEPWNAIHCIPGSAADVHVKAIAEAAAEIERMAGESERLAIQAGQYAAALIEITSMGYEGAPDIAMRNIARKALGGGG